MRRDMEMGICNVTRGLAMEDVLDMNSSGQKKNQSQSHWNFFLLHFFLLNNNNDNHNNKNNSFFPKQQQPKNRNKNKTDLKKKLSCF